MENVRISGWQYFLLTLNLIVGNAFFIRPAAIVAAAKEDGWIVPLWAGTAGIALACLWLLLVKNHPGLSLVQICLKVAGNKIGGLIVLAYIWFFIQMASWVTRNLSDFMKVILLPSTPKAVVQFVFLLIVCYASVKGIEAIARISELLGPIIIFILLVICMFALSEWRWERFGHFQMDVWKTMGNAKSIIGFPFMEAVALLMFAPYVARNLKKGLLLGIGAATLMLSGIVFVTIGTLGVTRTVHFLYPLYVITQELQIAAFIEHVEILIVIVWVVWIFIKLCIAYHCAVTGFCQLFKLKDRTWVALPLIVLVSGLATTFAENAVETIEWDKHYGFIYISIYGFVIPVLLLVLTWIRNARQA